MKEKAFTLTELLAVIAILAIVAVITAPTILDVLNNSKTSLNDEQVNSIISAAKNWGTANLNVVSNAPSQKYVTIGTLQDEGFLDDKDIQNIKTKKNISKTEQVCIKWSNNQFVYTFKEGVKCA